MDFEEFWRSVEVVSREMERARELYIKLKGEPAERWRLLLANSPSSHTLAIAGMLLEECHDLLNSDPQRVVALLDLLPLVLEDVTEHWVEGVRLSLEARAMAYRAYMMNQDTLFRHARVLGEEQSDPLVQAEILTLHARALSSWGCTQEAQDVRSLASRLRAEMGEADPEDVP
jgi:hypothetical protein